VARARAAGFTPRYHLGVLSPIALMTFTYLVVGLATTIIAWAQMPDEIEMAITMDLEDEKDRPLLRGFITVMFVLSWPMVLAEVFRKR
jgi:hypothetical protein